MGPSLVLASPALRNGLVKLKQKRDDFKWSLKQHNVDLSSIGRNINLSCRNYLFLTDLPYNSKTGSWLE